MSHLNTILINSQQTPTMLGRIVFRFTDGVVLGLMELWRETDHAELYLNLYS